MDSPSFDLQELKRVIEAALLTAGEPLALADLSKLFDEELGSDTLRDILDELARDWEGRGTFNSIARCGRSSRSPRRSTAASTSTRS
mgnify:CR=1 FL=1